MIEILFPVGRLVGGSLYQGNSKDDKGQPLVYKSGKNAGQPRTSYSFGVAFKKGPEQHWNATPWGQQIYAEAQKTAATTYQGRFFAWKVTDGDSTEPNKKGNKPCEREGYPGHWVVWFSGNFPPMIYNANGTERILEADAVKPGYFVQVFGNTEFNANNDSPGMYLNYNLVAFSAYGTEIQLSTGPDAASVGFGGQLPEGASTAPAAGMSAPPAAQTQQTPPPPPAQQAAAHQPPPPPHTGYMGADQTPPPPPPAAFPPAGWWPHPQAPGSFYNAAGETLTEAALRARG